MDQIHFPTVSPTKKWFPEPQVHLHWENAQVHGEYVHDIQDGTFVNKAAVQPFDNRTHCSWALHADSKERQRLNFCSVLVKELQRFDQEPRLKVNQSKNRRNCHALHPFAVGHIAETHQRERIFGTWWWTHSSAIIHAAFATWQGFQWECC